MWLIWRNVPVKDPSVQDPTTIKLAMKVFAQILGLTWSQAYRWAVTTLTIIVYLKLKDKNNMKTCAFYSVWNGTLYFINCQITFISWHHRHVNGCPKAGSFDCTVKTCVKRPLSK